MFRKKHPTNGPKAPIWTTIHGTEAENREESEYPVKKKLNKHEKYYNFHKNPNTYFRKLSFSQKVPNKLTQGTDLEEK